jgi:hypothetical protein
MSAWPIIHKKSMILIERIFFYIPACAPGTYKKYPGLAEKSCTKCPANSGSSKLGSITIQDCECKKGYEGTPASGSDCTSKRLTTFFPIYGSCF